MIETLLRELAPQVLSALVRRYGAGQFQLCEDAVQEALLAAAVQWPAEGVPGNPRGWLITVAVRRLLDQVRSEQARRVREDRAAAEAELQAEPVSADDSLALLFGCCHPALSVPSQIALTLRAIGGLSTAQIAVAFGVPEATMAQRISRAKQTLNEADADFTLHPGQSRERLPAVLHVLYLVFSEGYAASEGDAVTAPVLSDEAIRLTRWLSRLLPDGLLPDGLLPDGLLPDRLLPEYGEVTGLLALMLLTDARRPARTGPDGGLVPLAEQDRDRWDRDKIDEGTALITGALSQGDPGPYQLQAAIAAVHDEAAQMDDTDWPQILGLYDLLLAIAPNPFTALNRAVAVAMVHGPGAALALLAELGQDKRMATYHRFFATRGHLHELDGEMPGAAADYQRGAELCTNGPERRHLAGRAKKIRAAM